MAARAAQFKNQNNDSRSRPLLRASDLEVRSRLRNMNVGVNYKALLLDGSQTQCFIAFSQPGKHSFGDSCKT